jgi:hypothetical protein
MLESLESVYEFFVPPVKTPDQRVQESRGNMKQELRQVRSALTRNEIEQELARKAFDKATNKKDRPEALIQTKKLIGLERQRNQLELEESKLTGGEHRMDSMIRNQVRQQALVTTMAYTNTKSLPVTNVQHIAMRYEMTKDASKIVDETIESALNDSDEELLRLTEQQYTPSEEARMRDMMASYDQSVNQRFIEEMPAIGGRHVSQSLRGAKLTADEMNRETAQGAKELQAFLSQTRGR